MRLQLIKLVDPGCHRQHRHSQLLRRLDVIGGIADEADLCPSAEMGGRLLHGVAENVMPELVAVTEASNRETIPDPGRLELGPSNALQVPGTHADKLSCGKEGIEQFADRWTQFRSKLRRVLFHLVSHDFLGWRKTLFEAFALHSTELGGGAQDADVGIAVHRNVLDSPITLIDVLERRMEGVVMHPITAVEQSAVNIEEISVKAAPRKIAGHWDGFRLTHPSSLSAT